MKQRLKAWGDTEVVPIAGCFIFNDSGEVLLLKRHSADLGGGQWGVPAGRTEDGEDPIAGMMREIFEETGINVIEARPLGVHLIKMPHGTVSMSSFVSRVPDETVVVLDPEEHEAYAWFKPESVLSAPDILWGEPTMLRDYGFVGPFSGDPTLMDGSEAILVSKA